MHGTWSQSPERYYDYPPPSIRFLGNLFILTGIFAYGERKAIEAQIHEVGGRVVHRPTMAGCYVVVGSLPTKDWLTNDAGTKLLDALEMRDQRKGPVFIVSEDHFVAELYKEQQAPLAPAREALPVLTADEVVLSWFASLDMTGLEGKLTWDKSEPKSEITLHLTGHPKHWLCRIFGDPVQSIRLHKGYKYNVGYVRSLPRQILALLQDRVTELVAIQHKIDNPPVSQRLSPEELQRRNTERKAAMRAKPATPEILEAAEKLMASLANSIPADASLEGQDRAKYYAIALVPGNWLCRLHYKTKNKYIEINGEKPIPVSDFSRICEFSDAIAEKMFQR